MASVSHIRSLSPTGYERELKAYGVGEVLKKGYYGRVCVTQDPNFVAKCQSPRARHATPANPFRQKIYAQRAEKELSILNRILGEPNLPKQIDAFCVEGQRYTSIQKHAGEDLTKLFLGSKSRRNATIYDVQKIALQLFKALATLHKLNIYHADVKPSNILLDKRGNLTLADFSISKQLPNKEAVVGYLLFSHWYRPPEILCSMPSGIKGDIWAAGCTLAELLYRRPIFKGADPEEVLHAICVRFEIESNSSEQTDGPRCSLKRLIESLVKPSSEEERALFDNFKDFILKTIALEPGKRLSAEEALKHPFLASLDLDNNSEEKVSLDDAKA